MRDIVDNAARIEAYLADSYEDAFVDDVKSIDAAERCLERIAEAVVKIGAERMAVIAPAIPFERIRGLGNRLRHAYDELDARILFAILRHDVPVLHDAALRALI